METHKIDIKPSMCEFVLARQKQHDVICINSMEFGVSGGWF